MYYDLSDSRAAKRIIVLESKGVVRVQMVQHAIAFLMLPPHSTFPATIASERPGYSCFLWGNEIDFEV